MKLNIKALYNFIDVKPFADKDVYILNKMLLNNSKISEIIEQIYYGNVNFIDNKHSIWDIDLCENFDNNNVIIVKLKHNIPENPQNNNYLIIYQNLTKALNSYGYFWLNKDNNMTSMHISIEYLMDNLLYLIIQDINLFPKIKLYNAKFNIPKLYNNVELEQIYKEYIETYRTHHYDDWVNLSHNKNDKFKI